MQQLRSIDRKNLLAHARAAIAERLDIKYTQPAKVDIGSKSGVFVTLTIKGELRGCIGCFASQGQLADTVREFAVSAAFEDTRFPPVEKNEFEKLHIEISVLSEPHKTSHDDLITMFPSHPGVILKKGNRSSTFLPQVWEELSNADEFMSHLCMKAGLQPDEWKRPGMDFQTYSVEKFEE